MANNRVQVKRTSTTGRTPNTTGSYATNSQYISAGELALNMTDGILYTSNGSSLITIGANLVNQRITNALTLDNNKNLRFTTVNTSAVVSFIQQNDDNFVMYSTNTAYGQRAIWSVYANSISNLQIQVPLQLNAGLVANGGLGSAGQVLTSNGTTTYWSTVSGGGGSVNTAAQYTWTNTHTFQANVSFTGNGIGLTTNTAAIYLGGLADNNWKIGRNTGSTTKWRYTNNSIDIITANSNLEGFAIGLISGNSYFETGYLGTFIAANVTIGNSSSNSTINSTAFSGSANNTTYVNGKTEGNLNVNSALTSNNSSFLGGTAAASYQLNSTLNANIASYLPTYTGIVNGSSHTVGTSFTANATVVNAVSYYAGTTLIGNTTGPYGKTEGSLNVNNATTAYGKTEGNLNVNSATQATNATNLNSQPSSFYTNATNITTGTLPYAQIPANIINTTAAFTISGIHTYNANIVLGSSGLSANGSFGTSGQVLHSNGTATYWAADDNAGGTVTSVASGNGITGGTITTTGTLTAVGGAGLVVNTSGINVLANTGIVANSTGTFVNATYIGTLSANNASFLGGTAAASYQLNSTLSANVATLTANNASFLGGTAAASYQLNSTLGANIASYLPTYTGVVNGSSHTVGSSFIANSTGVYTGVVNGSSHTVGTAFTANATMTNTVSLVVSTNTATIGTGTYFVSSGNVGIGTSSPTNKLQIQRAGGAAISGELWSGDGTYWTQLNSRQSAGAYSALVAAGDHALIYSDGTAETGAFVIGQWSSSAKGIRIDASGNVGIATATPDAKLAVSGTANVSGNVTIGNSSFANTFLNSSTGISNPQSLTAGVLQTSATLNTLIVGPYTISSGNSLIITAGSRLVII